MITREQRDEAVKVLVQWGRQAIKDDRQDEFTDGQAMALALWLGGAPDDLAGRVMGMLGDDKSMWLVPGLGQEKMTPVVVEKMEEFGDGTWATVRIPGEQTAFLVKAGRLHANYKAALARVRGLTEQGGDR